MPSVDGINVTSSQSESNRNFIDAMREPHENELVDSLIRVGFVVALSGLLAFLNPALGAAFFVGSVVLGLAVGPSWVRRSLLCLFGWALAALGMAMFMEGDLDNPGDKLFAASFLVVGLLNVSAGTVGNRVQRQGLVIAVVNALFIALVCYRLRDLQIG